jgi:hypothetical protein
MISKEAIKALTYEYAKTWTVYLIPFDEEVFIYLVTFPWLSDGPGMKR